MLSLLPIQVSAFKFQLSRLSTPAKPVLSVKTVLFEGLWQRCIQDKVNFLPEQLELLKKG